MKRMLTAFGMSAALGITSAAAETPDEDTRWVVGSLQRGGAEEPVASFLTRDYAWVAFRATCDREARELVIDYVEPESVGSEGTVPPGDAISIGYMRAEGERWLALSTTFEQGWMTGRIAVGPDLLKLLSESNELAVWTPDSGDSPWFAGYGEPLREIVESCRPST